MYAEPVVVEVRKLHDGEVPSMMSQMLAESLGATDEDIDGANEPGFCLSVNGQAWVVNRKFNGE